MTFRSVTRVLSVLLIVLGLLVLARTISVEGPSGLRRGYLIGAALMVAGVARLRLSAHAPEADEDTASGAASGAKGERR